MKIHAGLKWVTVVSLDGNNNLARCLERETKTASHFIAKNIYLKPREAVSFEYKK